MSRYMVWLMDMWDGWEHRNGYLCKWDKRID
jgi:hypothetical protein